MIFRIFKMKLKFAKFINFPAKEANNEKRHSKQQKKEKTFLNYVIWIFFSWNKLLHCEAKMRTWENIYYKMDKNYISELSKRNYCIFGILGIIAEGKNVSMGLSQILRFLGNVNYVQEEVKSLIERLFSFIFLKFYYFFPRFKSGKPLNLHKLCPLPLWIAPK